MPHRARVEEGERRCRCARHEHPALLPRTVWAIALALAGADGGVASGLVVMMLAIVGVTRGRLVLMRLTLSGADGRAIDAQYACRAYRNQQRSRNEPRAGSTCRPDVARHT